MIGKMAEERCATVYATDERFCIDNGIMIAHAGLEMFRADPLKATVSVADSACCQRFRTDQVLVTWHSDAE